MPSTLARYGARVSAGSRRLYARPLTLGAIIATAITIGCFAVIAFWPILALSDNPWTVSEWKMALAISWPAVVAAAYLKLTEKISHKVIVNRELRTSLRAESLATAQAIMELDDTKKGTDECWQELQHSREVLLQSIITHIRIVLAARETDRLVASLVDFSTGNTDDMRIVARSAHGRKVPIEYPKNRLAAWEAITNAAPAVIHDILDDTRWEPLGKKEYRSVIAIPVTDRKGRGFGAVSIDSSHAYFFYSKSNAIALKIQPYVALLALTYTSDCTYHECDYDPAHYKE